MEHVYSSIDIGSDTIKIVVCELYKNHLNLLAATSSPARGIKKGLIVDPKEAQASIAEAFKDVEDMLGIEIKKVIASVPSYQAEYKIIKGETTVIGDTITSKDMNNAYKIGIKQALNPNNEFVTVIPIDFKINDKTVMKDPKDFPGDKLMGRAMMVMTPKKNVYSVASILESLGIEIVDISVGSIGDINSFRNKEIDNDIGAVINVGSEVTTVSLYNKGIPVNTKIVGMGGKDIDNDIAYMYKINTVEAKKVKEKFAFANRQNANVNDVYETTNLNGQKIKINQLEVSEVVMCRVQEILSLAKNEINLLTNRQIKYIIVTGGVSNALNFEYTVHDVLGSNAYVGKIKLIGVRNNKYSTALGNIIYFISTLKLKGQDYTMLSKSDMEILSSPDKHFINTSNETMLGKVFGYFFGE